MKKNNQKGFVLAETLVVTVFLMVIFAMVYSNFYPLVGEYEKREVYDDVDGKYSAYWLKQMIESAVYDIQGDPKREKNFNDYGYVRFECRDLAESDSRTVCKNVVSSLQINGCDQNGNYCDIFITNYRIGNPDDETGTFKATVKNNLPRFKENCSQSDDACKTAFVEKCTNEHSSIKCDEVVEKKVFSNGFQDYVIALPDYVTPSLNYANYRVLAVVHNVRDNNNYYSYSTIEISR